MMFKVKNFALLFILVTCFQIAVLESAGIMGVELTARKPVKMASEEDSLPPHVPIKKGGKSVCYGILGCFGIHDFYGLLKRPINLTPQSPERINTTYYLYTQNNRYKPNIMKYNFKREELEDSYFDPKKKTKFIIHGFGSSFDIMAWMGDIKDLIFALGGDKYNVFGVDWSQGADTIIYQQAVANTRIVGAATAHFIYKLVKYKGVNVEDIHLIGHSLGSHISGYIGERFKNPQIGRITGLDPAGPDFYENIPEARLDRTDAKYVDAIHTDYGTGALQGLGIWDTVGMDDFYPNSGYTQPGCGMSKGLYEIWQKGFKEGIGSTMACSHRRAWILYIVDLNTYDEKCQFVGYECESWNKFIEGQCGDCGEKQEKCGVFSVFGADDPNYGNLFRQHMDLMRTMDTKNRRLYFKTGEHEPFCTHHYQMVIHFADDMPNESKGSIKLDLHGWRRMVEGWPFGGGVNTYKSGMRATDLGTWIKSLGKIQSVTLSWKAGSYWTFWGKKNSIYVKKIEMNYMSNFDPQVRKKLSSVLCPQTGQEIKTGTTVKFELCPEASG